MPNEPERSGQPGNEHAKSRIEQVIARIDEHLTALDEATCDLHAEATRAERDGCTYDEIDAIDEIYVRAPLEMLLTATKTIINAMPPGSGFDLDRIVQLIDRHATAGNANYEIAEDLLELLRECIAHIRKEVTGTEQQHPQLPVVH
ncbi:MAG: hypothetical protein F4137_22565 [Acidobacteria bacterium]|nr:hypothetical protein [Acidobacteriota bacterium]